jgi:hypothetical protein
MRVVACSTTYALAQSSGNELTNEIERGATQIWNQQRVLLASELRGIQAQIDTWSVKVKNLAANSKETQNVGLYGDSKALSQEPFKPTQVALATQQELATAIQVKTEQLEGIRKRRSVSDAWYLYRDEMHAVVALNSLQGMLTNATEDLRLSKIMELYFELRLAVASSVSTEVYKKELKNAKENLTQTWQIYQKAQPATSRMMNYFLSY